MKSKSSYPLSAPTPSGRPGFGRAAILGLALAAALPIEAGAQTIPTLPTPIAPSQVTPRTLRPAPPIAATPLDLDESTPVDVPPGAEQIGVTVQRIVVEGEFPEMEAMSRRLLAPLEGRAVTVADLYRGAGALEKAYSDAGYFLARVVVVQQRLSDSDSFRIRVVDGFIESVDTRGLSKRLRRPVERVLKPIVGKRHITLPEMERRLNSAAAIPGITLRSTLARGEEAGGARLILEGRHKLAGLSIGGDNRLGPSFDDWGLNVQARLNSPLGLGEQLYLFLSGDPRIDRAFRRSAPRRVAGVGALVPITASGLAINPEFTVSDTHPIAANPILATSGRLYRGALSLSHPLLFTSDGALAGRATIELISETQRLPFFGVDISKDRLAVLRGNLSWRGTAWRNASIATDVTLSQGLTLFGARTAADIANSETPTSRGSDPTFTRADALAVVQQAIGKASSLTVIARAQTSFGTVVPSSELFELGGLDSLSPLTAGLLSTDSGATLRGELAHRVPVGERAFKLQLSPYLFAAAGVADPVTADPFSPTRAAAIGAGVRVNTSAILGASPTLTLEYGHVRANRGAGSSERLSVLYGVSF